MTKCRSVARLCILFLIAAEAAAASGQDLQLPDEYRPIPRVKRGSSYGSLASASRAIHLDESREAFEVDGRGVGVVIIGTGVTKSENIAVSDRSVPGFEASPDEHGLGTFLAALISGRGMHRGIAPGVELFSLKIVGPNGTWSAARLTDALHAVETLPPSRVVLLALTDGGHYQSFQQAVDKHGDSYIALRAQIDQLRSRGILVIAPAGDRQLSSQAAGLAFPAIVPGIVACPAVAVRTTTQKLGLDEKTVSFEIKAGQLLPTSQRPDGLQQDDAGVFPKLAETFAAPGNVEISAGVSERQAQLREGSMQAAAIVAACIALQQQYYERLAGKPIPVETVLESMQKGAAVARGRPERLTGAVITEDALEGRFPQIDLLQTLNIIRAGLSEKANEAPPSNTPRAIEGRQFGDLSEIADGISLKEAVNRFAQDQAAVQPPRRHELTGAGTCVAILATGVIDHPDFGHRLVERVDFTNSTPDDEHGYGTFMAGVIAAGQNERPGGNRGVAPGARIVSVKVLDKSGGGRMEMMLDGLSWVAQNRERLGITAVVIAGGSGKYVSWDQAAAEQPAAEAMRTLVKRLHEAHVVVIAPAGNTLDGERLGMGFPAIIPEVLSVAAMEFERGNETLNATDEAAVQTKRPRSGYQIPARMAPYSLRLPNNTDIVAPGGPVISSSLNVQQGQAMRGTAIAAAIVTGTVLLVQDYYFSGHKKLPPSQAVEDCIKKGAWYIQSDVPDVEFPRLDVLGAIRQCYLGSMVQQKSP